MATLFQLAADDSATKRLDRARLQYENLLLSAGNTLSDNFHGQSPGLQRSMGEFSAAPTLSFPRMELPASPDRDDPLSRSVDHSRGSHSFAYNAMRSPIRSHAVEEMSGPTISNEEKSDVILSLQEENERLKQKLNFALEAAQQVIQDAQETNSNIISECEDRIYHLERQNDSLKEENCNLRALLERTQGKLAEEHDSSQKTVRALQRFRDRSHDYLETQRKIHHILRDPAGLHYTSAVAKVAPKEQGQAQQQMLQQAGRTHNAQQSQSRHGGEVNALRPAPTSNKHRM